MGVLSIVQVNVSQTAAPAPSTLQQTGAICSMGSTDLTPGTLGLITQLSDYTAIANAPVAITSITWASGTATVTTATAHGWTVSSTPSVVIAGAVPVGYNGTFTATITGTSTFTYPLATNPGSETTPGTAALANDAETLAMVTTFLAQGNDLAVYVLELGEVSVVAAIAALSTYLTNNPSTIYSFLVPREFDNQSTFLSLLASYESTTAKTYFFITTTLGTYTNYTATEKCAVLWIDSPNALSTEFGAAGMFYVTLNYNPSPINQVTPTAYSYLFGITPYPTVGNAATRVALKSAGVNIGLLGSEGGISNVILCYGTTRDLHDFTYWYSVDWVQINLDENITNAIINGSNNPQNPLYYDQQGITTLQTVAQKTMNSGITFGLVLGPVTVTAVPFATYVVANPGDYPEGIYRGLAVTYTPQRGFIQIVFNVDVTSFPVS